MTASDDNHSDVAPPWWSAVERLRSDPKDEEAWRKLVEGIWPMLIVGACRAMGHWQVTQNAEDAATDCLVYIARHWPLRATSSPWRFRRFLRWLVHRRVIDERRASTRHQSNVAEDIDHLEARREDASRVRDLDEFMALFARDETDLKLLRFLIDGWTQTEIAAEIRVHPSTISRKFNRMRELWQRFCAREDSVRI